MHEKKPKRKNPLTKGVIKFFAIWHCALFIPILISLLLPWINGMNFFKLAFEQSPFISSAERAFVAFLSLFLLFGISLGIPEILCISAAFDYHLARAQRKLQYAWIFFIFIPLTCLFVGFVPWGLEGSIGYGGRLFLILWAIYSFIALGYIIFLIIADYLKYFPEKHKK